MAERRRDGDPGALLSARLIPLDTVVPRLLRNWKIPGAAVAVTDRERVLFSRGYGWRDPRRRLPVTDTTNFAICSATKAMTAVSIGVLTDDGGIEWDRPLRDFVPSFRMDDPVLTERLTVRDLLSHRSGIAANDCVWMFSPLARAELARRVLHLAPNNDLRSTYQYNNLLYMLAGSAVEKITGMTWEEFVRQRLFGPLGMATSQFATDSQPLTDNYAVGHALAQMIPAHLFAHRRRENSFAAGLGAIAPAGGVVTNALDMCRWLRMHLNDGEVPGPDGTRVSVISSKNLAQVHAPAIPMPPGWPPACPELTHMQQASGLVVASYRGHPCLFHTGCFGGFRSMQMLLPEQGLASVILHNADHSPVELIILYMINDILLDLEPVNWNRWARALWRERAETRAGAKESPRRGTRPSHAMVEYAGRYEHPAYGQIGIEEKSGRLIVHYNGFALRTRHYHYDVFETLPDTRGIPYGGFKVRFHTALNGAVDGVSVAFFLSDEPVFGRVGD